MNRSREQRIKVISNSAIPLTSSYKLDKLSKEVKRDIKLLKTLKGRVYLSKIFFCLSVLDKSFASE